MSIMGRVHLNYRSITSGCVALILICFGALYYHHQLFGAHRQSRFQIGFSWNDIILTDRNGSSSAPEQHLINPKEIQQISVPEQRPDSSKEIQQIGIPKQSMDNSEEPQLTPLPKQHLDNFKEIQQISVPEQHLNNTKENLQDKEDPSEWLTRTNWQSKIDLHTYQYLINPESKCEISRNQVDSSKNLTLLVLVKSAPGNSELRDAIRSTYMQGALKYNVSCRVFFLLGFPADDERKQGDINKEAETHGDIIQEDFIDSYYNLTTKVIMGVKWAMTFCKNAEFVMFIDDDVMVDIVTLINDLSTSAQYHHTDFVLGEVTRNAVPFRDPTGYFKKFYTPKTLYPYAKYPMYPQGYAYIISNDVVPRLYYASLELPPPVPWEDVYFGALLRKLKLFITDRKPWYKRRHFNTVRIPSPLVPKDDYFKIELSIDAMHEVWNAIDNE